MGATEDPPLGLQENAKEKWGLVDELSFKMHCQTRRLRQNRNTGLGTLYMIQSSWYKFIITFYGLKQVGRNYIQNHPRIYKLVNHFILAFLIFSSIISFGYGAANFLYCASS